MYFVFLSILAQTLQSKDIEKEGYQEYSASIHQEENHAWSI